MTLGAGPHPDFNRFLEVVMADASAHGVKLTAKRKNLLRMALASREEAAAPVIKKIHKTGAVEPDPIRGLIEVTVDGQSTLEEYEPDPDLRDTEQIPLLEEGRHRERSSAVRCCPMRRTPGTPRTASRSATRSALPVTSTSPSHSAHWKRYGRTSWR